MPAKLRYSVPDAAKVLGISEPTLWRRIRARDVLAIKDGRRTFIPGAELRRYALEGTTVAE